MAYSLKEILRMNLFCFILIGAIIIGVTLGIILKQVKDTYTTREISYVNFIGGMFLSMLKALILPLIFSTLISAIGDLDLEVSGKMGSRALFYYISTTIIAVILGILLVITFRPGVGSSGDIEGSPLKFRNITTVDTLLDLVRNMFPPNIIQACIASYETKLEPKNWTDPENDLKLWDVSGQFVDQINMMGLVLSSIVVGIALSAAKEDGQNLVKVFKETSQLSLQITSWIIWLSPIAIISLICSKVIETNNAGELFRHLGFYSVTVVFGVLLHGFAILPIIFFIFTRKNPYVFISNMSEALVTAFGTASSSATLPVTIACAEKKNNVAPSIARFVLPIGATINMDGAALYLAVAAIYVAQVRRISLGIFDLLAIGIVSVAASVGTAAVPQAGLVTMVMVLSTIGLPAEDVALVISVDWLLDRFRTTINVMGDAVGAGIISHISENEAEYSLIAGLVDQNVG